ncbi:MAG: metallophosphoesterase family protein [Pseudomonadota bacterium]
MLVGLISDTHRLLRPEALDALSSSDMIIHAGDIGAPEVIDQLREIAPVEAVRGNIDKAAWADAYPLVLAFEHAGTSIYVLHNRADLDLDPAKAGYDVVVSGHSHKPNIETRDGVLYINPGSAGPRRFSLPICVARLNLGDGQRQAEIIDLAIT